jgi:glutaredoxin
MPETEHSVVLFSQGWCEFSEMVRLHLESRGQPYLERDIDTDPDARAEMMKLGGTATPVTVIDGEVVIGYDDAAIDELLGFTPYNEPEDYSNPLVEDV